MTAPFRHKVVTFEQGDGFAARCTCAAQTVGSFTFRTEARAALVHENAPATVAAARGSDRPTNQQESETNMTIIPETDEARQMIREWALEYAKTSIAPDWPSELIPWWVENVQVTYFGGGEATVQFARKHGETEVSALVTVVVSNESGWMHNHPNEAVGNFHDDGIEVTVVGPHENMNIDEATDVFFSLAESVRLLRQIKDRAEVAA